MVLLVAGVWGGRPTSRVDSLDYRKTVRRHDLTPHAKDALQYFSILNLEWSVRCVFVIPTKQPSAVSPYNFFSFWKEVRQALSN
jgi:hypothetical protein